MLSGGWRGAVVFCSVIFIRKAEPEAAVHAYRMVQKMLRLLW